MRLRLIYGLVLFFFVSKHALLADEYSLDVPLLIQKASVTTAPGAKSSQLDVLVENGRISNIGDHLRVPPGARVIDASGLHLYAGFIDGWTRTGISDPKPNEADERRYESEFRSAAEGPFVSMMAANRIGIYPERSALDYLSITEKTFDEHRANGFTAALIAPPSAMLGGRTSLIATGDGPLRNAVIQADITSAASFDRPGSRAIQSRGRYPGTILGVIAALRQAFYDAQWYSETTTFGKDDPATPVVLPTDPALHALQDVLTGKLPIVWEAETEDEIDRAMERQQEFGFKMWVAGARRAFKRTDALKARETPIIVSLETQKEPKKYRFEAKKYRKAEDDTTLYGKAWESRPFEPEAATDELNRRRKEMLSNLSEVEKAGLTWCVSTGDEPKKALENLHAYQEAGATNESLLRALTVS
ncbi:MAG: hypothetical protein AB7N71_14290, partial [Phycisphaerae bacterium]